MRIFIAEPDKELRVALQMLLHQQAGVHVTGLAVSTEGLVAQVAATKPDVLLLDWYLPEEPMLDLLAQLGQADPRPQIVVMSVRAEVEQEALAAGADAFVKKNVPPQDLLAVLDSLSAEDKTETDDEFDPV